MYKVPSTVLLAGLLVPFLWGSRGVAGMAGAAIELRATAQVAKKTFENGHERITWMPADRVVPGDEVLYTVEVRNTGPVVLESPTFTIPVPAHMLIIPGSAVGPGAEVGFSVDGGRRFDLPERLTVTGPRGAARPARPLDYTHVRWTLHIRLRSRSVAFVRYRAVLQ